MTILIFQKLTLEDAILTMSQMEIWFRKNPTRKICKTQFFKVRKGYLVEDVLKHTEQ